MEAFMKVCHNRIAYGEITISREISRVSALPRRNNSIILCMYQLMLALKSIPTKYINIFLKLQLPVSANKRAVKIDPSARLGVYREQQTDNHLVFRVGRHRTYFSMH